MFNKAKRFGMMLLLVMLALPMTAAAHGDHDGAIYSDENEAISAEFDIVVARVLRIGSNVIFQIIVAGEAGASIPEAIGQVPGAEVLSYVWPTTLDPSAVGFEAGQGILALAVTSHPDFDDTPLWDEDGDGDPTNDGAVWHSHWVVLVADDACGDGGLKVRDIAEGETPALPATWPELPLFIDSPNYTVDLFRNEVVVYVPYADLGDVDGFNFDGVAAGLQVNANLHNPFLCVTGVFDIASGDLSLPGTLEQ